MAKKPDREEVMLDLVQRYDKARLIAKEAKNEADELNSEIKAILADKEELPLPGWTVTYRYDKDKEIEAFISLNIVPLYGGFKKVFFP